MTRARRDHSGRRRWPSDNGLIRHAREHVGPLLRLLEQDEGGRVSGRCGLLLNVSSHAAGDRKISPAAVISRLASLLSINVAPETKPAVAQAGASKKTS